MRRAPIAEACQLLLLCVGYLTLCWIFLFIYLSFIDAEIEAREIFYEERYDIAIVSLVIWILFFYALSL